MPRKYPIGGESRLSIEGLRGTKFEGKKISGIRPHGAKRRSRTVTFAGGQKKNYSIARLLDQLLKAKGYEE